ncbi:type II toxin-antitoxin system VapC family toxin, partial [Burkholderia ubonensis]
MTKLYMLDTNICSYIMRERPPVVLSRLQSCVGAQHRIVVSAVTYAEMRFGAIGRKASPKHADLVTAFVARLDGVLPLDAA